MNIKQNLESTENHIMLHRQEFSKFCDIAPTKSQSAVHGPA